jgi:hypothetical protein
VQELAARCTLYDGDVIVIGIVVGAEPVEERVVYYERVHGG